jgi:hypothetical protein
MHPDQQERRRDGCERHAAFLEKVQHRGKSLLIRGKLDHDDLKLLRDTLSPNGLYLQIVVESPAETKRFHEFFRPWE